CSAHPIGRNVFVLVGQHGAMALVVGQHGKRFTLRVVDAEDDQLAVDIAFGVTSDSRRIGAVRVHASVDVDGALPPSAGDVRGLQAAVGLDDGADDLVDQE